jgi:diguanylate cyclase (GGDEF)-like protein
MMNGGLSDAIAVRVLIGSMVWTTIVEVLAAFASEQRRLNRVLNHAAMSDALTGIPNRRDLETRLTTAREGDAVVLCDLDHFKALNDTRGHHAGDKVLADFGALLRLQLREGDYCARYGGEEFLLLLPDTSPAVALGVLARLRSAWQIMGAPTTFSAGVASCHRDRPIDATLAAADAALYAAKTAGRGTDRTESAFALPRVAAVQRGGPPTLCP